MLRAKNVLQQHNLTVQLNVTLSILCWHAKKSKEQVSKNVRCMKNAEIKHQTNDIFVDKTWQQFGFLQSITRICHQMTSNENEIPAKSQPLIVSRIPFFVSKVERIKAIDFSKKYAHDSYSSFVPIMSLQQMKTSLKQGSCNLSILLSKCYPIW